MNLNEHVNLDTTKTYGDIFTPDEGYALWNDAEEGNFDENGQPIKYSLTIITPKSKTEILAPHIWAKLIDETMEVYGDGNKPSVY